MHKTNDIHSLALFDLTKRVSVVLHMTEACGCASHFNTSVLQKNKKKTIKCTAYGVETIVSSYVQAKISVDGVVHG